MMFFQNVICLSNPNFDYPFMLIAVMVPTIMIIIILKVFVHQKETFIILCLVYKLRVVRNNNMFNIHTIKTYYFFFVV